MLQAQIILPAVTLTMGSSHKVSPNSHLETGHKHVLESLCSTHQHLSWVLPQSMFVMFSGILEKKDKKENYFIAFDGIRVLVIIVIQEMTNKSQKPDLWEKRIVSPSGSSFILL